MKVVSVAVASTVNITGLRAITRGSSFLKALPMAGHKMAGSITLLWVLGCLVMPILKNKFSEEGPGLHRQMFDDGSKRQSGEEGQAAHDQDHAGEQADEQSTVRGEGAGRSGHDLLRCQRTRHRHH